MSNSINPDFIHERIFDLQSELKGFTESELKVYQLINRYFQASTSEQHEIRKELDRQVSDLTQKGENITNSLATTREIFKIAKKTSIVS